jgi:DNA polymerase-3 subunit alpha
MRYVSLHGHSTFSYQDGYGLPEAHVERVAELGMKALALTEHGNVTSHVKLEVAAQKAGVKPIFGLEAYTSFMDMRETGFTRKFHQTILAMNMVGLRNLYEMVTISWKKDFYRWPTILGDNMRDHSAGLIVSSGCTGSLVACQLLGTKDQESNYDAALATVRKYQKLFGERYYLEVQRFHELDETQMLNRQFEAWGKELGIPLMASSDVHYPRPEQNEMQKILHAAGRNTGTVARAEQEWEYDIRLTYPESDQEIIDNLILTGLSESAATEAVINTERIADQCDVTLPKMDRIRYPGTQRDLLPWAAPTATRSFASPTLSLSSSAESASTTLKPRRRR